MTNPSSDGTERETQLTEQEQLADACCGGPAPAAAEACCARDAEIKEAGGAGCGCNSPARTSESRIVRRCC
jgi:hypothetical protein